MIFPDMAATIARIAVRPAFRSLTARLVSAAPLIQSQVNILSSRAVVESVRIPTKVQTRNYSGKDPMNLQYIQER